MVSVPVQGSSRSPSIPGPRTIPAGREAHFLDLLKRPKPVGLLVLLRKVYADLFDKETMEILLRVVRSYTVHQYSSIWFSFCSFVRQQKPDSLNEGFVLSFLRSLFYVKSVFVNHHGFQICFGSFLGVRLWG